MTINLREIKQRCEKASPEPWEIDGGRHSVTLTASNGITIFHTGEYPGPGKTDAAFIATARTDVPALVAWIERAELVLTRAVHYCDHWGCKDPSCDCFICDAQRLLSEVTR